MKNNQKMNRKNFYEHINILMDACEYSEGTKSELSKHNIILIASHFAEHLHNKIKNQ